MPFHWDRDKVSELIGRCALQETNDYIREHLACMRGHLRDHDEYVTYAYRHQAWEDVSDEARKLEARLKFLKQAAA
jgi:hypothetical protein